jgi:hypothetical protein
VKVKCIVGFFKLLICCVVFHLHRKQVTTEIPDSGCGIAHSGETWCSQMRDHKHTHAQTRILVARTERKRQRRAERRRWEYIVTWSRDSVVGIVATLRAGRPTNRLSIPGEGKRLSVLQRLHSGPGAHPASYPSAVSLGDKQRGSKANHWPPFKAEFKKE